MKKAEEDLEKVQIRDEVSDVVCEQCGRNMVVKYGPHGKFPGLSWIPGMSEYQAVSGEDRREMSKMRKRGCAQTFFQRSEILQL